MPHSTFRTPFPKSGPSYTLLGLHTNIKILEGQRSTNHLSKQPFLWLAMLIPLPTGLWCMWVGPAQPPSSEDLLSTRGLKCIKIS